MELNARDVLTEDEIKRHNFTYVHKVFSSLEMGGWWASFE